MKKLLFSSMLLIATLVICSCKDDIPEIPEVGQFTTGAYVTEVLSDYSEDKSIREVAYEQEQYYAQLEVDIYTDLVSLINQNYTFYQKTIDLMFREKLNLDILDKSGFELGQEDIERKSHLDTYLEGEKMTYFIQPDYFSLEHGDYITKWEYRALEGFEDGAISYERYPEFVEFFKLYYCTYNSRGHSMFSMIKNNSTPYSSTPRAFKALSDPVEPLTYKVYYDPETNKTVVEFSRVTDLIFEVYHNMPFDFGLERGNTNKMYFPPNFEGTLMVAEVGKYGFVQYYSIFNIKSNLSQAGEAKFENKLLEDAVRSYLCKEENDVIKCSELASVKSLSFYKETVYINRSATDLMESGDKEAIALEEFSFEDLKFFPSLADIQIYCIDIPTVDLTCISSANSVDIQYCNAKELNGFANKMILKLTLDNNLIEDASCLSEMSYSSNAMSKISINNNPLVKMLLPDKLYSLIINNTKLKDLSVIGGEGRPQELGLLGYSSEEISVIPESKWETVTKLYISEDVAPEPFINYRIHHLYAGKDYYYKGEKRN